jgi:membrane protein DedA with SNARE-associated domain/pimeloyl-ACP methyl ester carboxylesterase
MSTLADRKRNLGRVPVKWIVLAAYVLLVLVSRWVTSADRQPKPELARAIEVAQVGSVGASGELPVVVVPSLPDRGEHEWRRTFLDAQPAGVPALGQVYVVRWPTSFHRSRSSMSDESVAADMLPALEAKFGRGRFHLVGEGMGGMVALAAATKYPDRVASLTLISAPGAQEYTLLGNAVANKFVYFFHHLPFVLLDVATPHFGLADRLPYNRGYSGVFFDSDLSDAKASLRGWNGPALLVHGTDDWITPVDAARYSAKLMPQAGLSVLAGGHGEEVVVAAAPQVARFIASVEAGQAAKRPAPVPAAEPYPHLVVSGGARFWILLLILVLCTFVAEDPTCLAAGLLAAEGIIGFWWAALACTVGIFIGDMVLYSLGRWLGRGALRRAPLKWIVKEHEIDRMAGWFGSPRGMLVIVSSRFIPASRVPTFVTAGILRLGLPRLSMLLFTAALVWTPVLMLLGSTLGPPFMEQFPRYKQYAAWIVLGLFAFIWLFTHWVVPAMTWRGRREIVMKVRGLMQPSLWPGWLLYLPVRLGIVLLSLRHRRLTAFASANPAFGRIGGFIGDAKSLLLRPFQRDSRCCPTLALSLEDTQEERVKEAAAFAACHGFPVVFKPEVAEDGAGLRFVHTQEQLERLVRGAQEDFLLQKFISGFEFEVVWRRNPGKDDGRIMAVVHKHDVTVRGDGEQTLEELIWLDEVAVSRANLFLRCHARDLNRVIPAGQQVTLNLTGSYGHGARCRHRADLATVELDAAVTQFAKRFPGLHFARFDLRATSMEDLKAGRFVVTEVGGCCQVSSLLRDESLRFSRSYAAVWDQLRACLDAGAYNLLQKVRPVPVDELMARWSQARGRHDEFAVSEEL